MTAPSFRRVPATPSIPAEVGPDDYVVPMISVGTAREHAEIQLTPDQERELRLYADGTPIAGKRPNTNLIRRNLLMRVAPHGTSTFVITEVGRAALAERSPTSSAREHAETVRDALRLHVPHKGDGSLAALDALLAKVEQAEERHVERMAPVVEALGDMQARALAAEALSKRRAEALRAIRNWDCLNPPDSKLCADHPWLKRLVDAALADNGQESPDVG